MLSYSSYSEELSFQKNHPKIILENNYKEAFEKTVTQLLKKKPTLEERIQASCILIEIYIKQTAEAPDGVQLQRLANWLLLDDLLNAHPDKVTRTDYPFLSKRQLRTRYVRERVDERFGII